MPRHCAYCQETFTAYELDETITREIENYRPTTGVEGLSIHCYSCWDCDHESLFVDVFPLPKEPQGDFRTRKAWLEHSVHARPLPGSRVVIVDASSGR